MIVPNLVFVLIGNAVYGIGSAFFGVLLGTATADVADYINLKNKTDLSGLSTSIAQFGMRFGMLLGSVGVAAVLAIGGYSGEAANAGLAQSSFTRVMETVGLRRNPPGVQYFAGAVQQPDGCRQRGGQHEKGRGGITWQTYSTVSTYRRTWAFPLSTSRTSCRSATRPTTAAHAPHHPPRESRGGCRPLSLPGQR